jgi:hypothetical protein
MSNPQMAHWNAVKHILRYLKGTTDLGIFYWRHSTSAQISGSTCTSPPLNFEAYSDADWAACPASRCSTGGYIFKLASGEINWSTKRQSTVSLSTTEAEYCSLACRQCQGSNISQTNCSGTKAPFTDTGPSSMLRTANSH